MGTNELLLMLSKRVLPLNSPYKEYKSNHIIHTMYLKTNIMPILMLSTWMSMKITIPNNNLWKLSFIKYRDSYHNFEDLSLSIYVMIHSKTFHAMNYLNSGTNTKCHHSSTTNIEYHPLASKIIKHMSVLIMQVSHKIVQLIWNPIINYHIQKYIQTKFLELKLKCNQVTN